MIDAEKMIAWVKAYEAFKRAEAYESLRRVDAPALVQATMALGVEMFGLRAEEAMNDAAVIRAIAERQTEDVSRKLTGVAAALDVIAADLIVAAVSRKLGVETEAPRENTEASDGAH